jgi:putative endonuclease
MGWLLQKRIDLLERSLAAVQWAARRSSRSMPKPAHLTTGIEGENAAFFYLGRKGYIVVARRWSSGYDRGDLDLIAWQGPLLCFVEVKTRTAHDVAAAEVTVDADKRNVLRKLARHYMRQLPMKTSPPVRFDVLSVYLIPGKEREFVHFEGAFGWSEVQEHEWR